MKKVISIIILATLIILNVSTVKAADTGTGQATATITLNTPTTIPVGTTTVTATINLGTITNLGTARVVGYTATLAYNTNLVEQVTMVGENGWTATCTNGAIVASIDNVEENKEIAKITFKLKEGLQAGQELSIALNNFRISNDDNLDQTLNLSKTVKLTAVEAPKEETPKEETPKEETPKNEVKNEVKNETKNEIKQLNEITNATTTNTFKSNTTTSQLKATQLPKAGQKNFIIIAIFVTIIVGIACIIRAKTIKLK